MGLSQEVKQFLKKFGWSDERKIDIKKQKTFLENEGYEVFESAQRFLSSFADIRFEIPLDHDKVHFDPIKAASNIFIENIKFYEERTGEKMIPVGENSYHYTLLLSISGKMYAGFDDFLFLLGDDYESAIETLYYDLDKIAIP